jgi:hypothetical protein
VCVCVEAAAALVALWCQMQLAWGRDINKFRDLKYVYYIILRYLHVQLKSMQLTKLTQKFKDYISVLEGKGHSLAACLRHKEIYFRLCT